MSITVNIEELKQLFEDAEGVEILLSESVDNEETLRLLEIATGFTNIDEITDFFAEQTSLMMMKFKIPMDALALIVVMMQVSHEAGFKQGRMHEIA